jgi:Flp pilus assembly pilin Flp
MLNLIVAQVVAATCDRRGGSSMEYGVLAVAVIIAVATVAGLLTNDLLTTFSALSDQISAAMTKAAGD